MRYLALAEVLDLHRLVVAQTGGAESVLGLSVGAGNPGMGRTKIEIEDALVEKARRLTGARSKREAVDIALALLRRLRTAWIKSFRAMAAHRDDVLLDETRPTRWDEEDWKWRWCDSKRTTA